MSIDKPLKNVNVLQAGTSKNATIALCSKITKPKNIFDETKAMKKAKITKQEHAFKNYAMFKS